MAELQEHDEVAALNAGIGRNSAVRREARVKQVLEEINAKLDTILARMGGEVKQTKAK